MKFILFPQDNTLVQKSVLPAHASFFQNICREIVLKARVVSKRRVYTFSVRFVVDFLPFFAFLSTFGLPEVS